MNNLKLHPIGSLFTGALVVLLLALSISGGIVTSSCNSRPAACDTAGIMAVKCAECPGTERISLLGTHLDTLMLTVSDYQVLKNTYPSAGAQRSKLVLQFYFNKDSASIPSLIAYASKPGNQFTQGAVVNPVWKVLGKGGGEALLLPDIFVLGDQQIRFDAIDPILSGSATDTLLFIPRIAAGEINVRYKVCLKGAACPDASNVTNPSPPANAN